MIHPTKLNIIKGPFNDATATMNQHGTSIIPMSQFEDAKLYPLKTKEDLKSFNTYKYWNLYDYPTIFNNGIGKKSLFSSLSGVNYQGIGSNRFVPLLDTPDNAKIRKKYTDCSIRTLVRQSGQEPKGSEFGIRDKDVQYPIYQYSDFMFCEDLGKFENNHLITLRRFTMPCTDDILTSQKGTKVIDDDKNSKTKNAVRGNPEIGRMVCWFGNESNKLDDIMRWSVNMKYKPMESNWERAGEASEHQGLGLLAQQMGSSSYTGRQFGGMGSGGPYSFLRGWRDSNKVYGPVDVIADTHIRENGIVSSMPIKIDFEYKLRSYDGINPKASFLDLIAHTLAVTYTSGKFWGGGRYGGPAAANSFYNSLNIFKCKDAQEIPDAMTKDIQSAAQALGLDKQSRAEGSTKEKLMDVLSTISSNLMNMFAGAALNKMGRPQKQATNSLLKGDPVGMWHLTIGNPYNPIATIGNLILDKAEYQLYGPLGFDDFPTKLKISCTFKQGMSRDNIGLEQMFTGGFERIHNPQGKMMFESSSVNSLVDKKTGKLNEIQPSTNTNAMYRNNPNSTSNNNRQANNSNNITNINGGENIKTINWQKLESLINDPSIGGILSKVRLFGEHLTSSEIEATGAHLMTEIVSDDNQKN